MRVGDLQGATASLLEFGAYGIACPCVLCELDLQLPWRSAECNSGAGSCKLSRATDYRLLPLLFSVAQWRVCS